MKKHYLFWILPILFAFECDPQIDFEENTRLLVKGRLVDGEGRPLSGYPVAVYASTQFSGFDGSFFGFDNDVVLGAGETDTNGDFRVTALSPVNASVVYTLINFESLDPFDPSLTPLVLNFLRQLPSESNTFDLQEVQLETLRPFNVELQRTVNLTDTLTYSLTYRSNVKEINFGPEEFGSNFPDQFAGGQLTPAADSAIEPLTVQVGDTVFLDYSLRNVVETGQGQIEIIIDATTPNFVYEF
ncbi:MAG: hypothetical protein HRT65_02720 [Flavobacteriaceae bacterium]|nr:hypothetical protein [Flavobacteriaceae bacterium]